MKSCEEWQGTKNKKIGEKIEVQERKFTSPKSGVLFSMKLVLTRRLS